VKCWGSNARGQTGQGAAGANVSSAAAVANLPSAVREVAAGGITNDGHTLAVLTTGAVIGWGFNDVGLLGDATTVGPRLTPVTASISAVTSLRTSFAHSCAVDALGALRCWGASFFGELGLGNITTSVPTPTVVTLPAQAAAVALGAYHTCALLVDGRVSCWGKNDYKQVGGALNEEPSPQLVTAVGSDAVRIIAGYYHSCALMKDGALKCWGGNYNGQLGSALPATSSATPLTVSGLPPAPIASVCAGSSHTCVLTTGGAVACWGWNYAGQLGDASNTSRPGPAVVSGLGSGVAELACGGEFTCARLMSGGVKCWGSNYQSVLGDGTGTDRSSPVSVLGL
jgi:alpha-tubulin suppressor-like RCC1 family protein